MTHEDMVAQVMALGYSRPLAEAQVARQHPELPRTFPAAPAPDENALEKAEQWECMRVYRAHGCSVYSLSQPRATKQTPGLPDLLVFAPRIRVSWWHEVKRSSGGVQSPAQAEFQRQCEQCRMPYLIGDRTVAARYLVSLGIDVEPELLTAGAR